MNIAMQRRIVATLILIAGAPLAADEFASPSSIPMLPIEREALADPDGVRQRLPGLLEAARRDADERTVAMLYLAEANACRVVADWVCQRGAGARAGESARKIGDRVLEARALIASGRGRIALGDYYAGERELGQAELMLAGGVAPALSADVYLGYSSLSHRLGKHSVAAEYAMKGLEILGNSGEPELRLRLLRNLARARAALEDWEAAESALRSADEMAGSIADVKLRAEIVLEQARLAHRRGDVQAQLAAADRVLALAEALKNTQLAGLAWEARGLAALQAGEPGPGAAALARAVALFRTLDLQRDERRVLGMIIREGLLPGELAENAKRYAELETTVAEADRAEAAHGFGERLKYAQQELEVTRLRADAEIARAESASLAMQSRYDRLLTTVSVVALLVVAAGFVLQRRAKRRLAAALYARLRAMLQTSHELRNALVAIGGVADQLLLQGLPGKASQQVQTIRKAADHLTRLAQDLLDRGRLESGRMTLVPASAELHALVGEVHALHAPLAREKGLRLVCKLDQLLALPPVVVDATRLQQVLTNLVSNALKFTDRGSVTIETKPVPLEYGRWRIVFAVTDTGCGIEASDLERIFEPFAQSTAGVAHSSGTGLGLAIARDLVALMGGELRVERVRPQGSRFTFSIVVEAGSAGSRTADIVPLEPQEKLLAAQAAAPLSVVAVDDDPVVLMLYEGMFARFDIEPRLHADLDEALSRHPLSEVDLLVIDYEIDGRPSVDAIREVVSDGNGDRPRIAIVSGHAAPEQLPRGIDEWLQKPVSPARLAMLVDAARRAAALRRAQRKDAA